MKQAIIAAAVFAGLGGASWAQGPVFAQWFAQSPASNPPAASSNVVSVYIVGGSTMRKLGATNLENQATATAYGGTAAGVCIGGGFVYQAGATSNSVNQYLASDLTFVNKTPNLGQSVADVIFAGGDVFAHIGTSNTVLRINTNTMTVTQSVAGAGTSGQLATDGTYIYAIGAAVRKYSASVLALQTSASVAASSIATDGTWVYLGRTGGIIEKRNASNLALVATNAPVREGSISELALSPDGATLFAGVATTNAIEKFATADLSWQATSLSAGTPGALATDGTWIWSGSSSGSSPVRRWLCSDLTQQTNSASIGTLQDITILWQ